MGMRYVKERHYDNYDIISNNHDNHNNHNNHNSNHNNDNNNNERCERPVMVATFIHPIPPRTASPSTATHCTNRPRPPATPS